MSRPSPIVCFVFLGGAACGAVLLGQFEPQTATAAQKTDARASNPEHDLAALRAQVAMVMADYHTTNLWFAGRAGNWPLANYYWTAVKGHIDLSAESDPSGKIAAKLKQIDEIEDSPTTQVPAAIRKQDARAFGAAYRGMLVACYDCHKAAGKPFLRPQMPVRPSRAIINMAPDADWPQ